MAKKKKADIAPQYLIIIEKRTPFSPEELGEMAGIHRSGFEHKKTGRQSMMADDFLRLLKCLKRRMARKKYQELIKELFVD